VLGEDEKALQPEALAQWSGRTGAGIQGAKKPQRRRDPQASFSRGGGGANFAVGNFARSQHLSLPTRAGSRWS